MANVVFKIKTTDQTVNNRYDMDPNDLTVGDCIFIHEVFGLDVVCEDGNAGRVENPDPKICKEL